MATLPIEIWKVIFKNLERRDWLQCQLTSKKWYEASIVFLYSEVTVNTLDKSRLYANTLNNSSRLGEYLETIDTRNIFQYNEHTESWDEHNLLDALIQKCPNLLEIESFEPDTSFWSRILYAATQGQLSRLQSLPGISGKSFETGVYATLLFKSTLAHISLKSEPKNLTQLKAYQILQDQINEFKSLTSLGIDYVSDKQLSSIDELIENCPYLYSLSIVLHTTAERRVSIESGRIINPRSDIKFVLINWDIINNENEIRYLIQKFPNLDTLLICCTTEEFEQLFCPSGVVIKLFRYATTIPKFGIRLPVRILDLANIWIELMSMNDMYRDVTIETYFHQRPSKVYICIGEDFSEVRLILNKNLVELPHTDFFLETGHMLRSLKMEIHKNNLSNNDLDSIDWIIQVIELCPLLNELTLVNPNTEVIPRTSYSVFQHTSITKLTASGISIIQNYILFFKEISLRLPNIRQLYLDLRFLVHSTNDKTLTLFMPNTQLDLLNLIIRFGQPYMNGDKIIVYIRLRTDSGLKFYKDDNNGLVLITEESYMRSNQEVRLDITCRILKELKTIMEGKQRSYSF